VVRLLCWSDPDERLGPDIVLQDPSALPGCEPHVGLFRIGTLPHDLGGRHAGGREVHLVLHGGEEQLCLLFALAVVAGQCEDLADPLVDACLTGPDVADARRDCWCL
jgi:hypothetical protein